MFLNAIYLSLSSLHTDQTMNLKLATLAITLNLVSSLAVAKNSRDQKNDSFINNRVPWITRGNHAATPVNGAKANSVQYKEKWAGIEDKSMKNGVSSEKVIECFLVSISLRHKYPPISHCNLPFITDHV